MKISQFFSQVRAAIETEQFDRLADFPLKKPTRFNWVKDIFYPLNVKQNPSGKALIWRNGEQEKHYTFQQIYQQSNQFLNFLRKHGIEKGDKIYTQLPVVPANWLATLAAIKGGLVLIPAATTLTEKDIAWRFETLFPEVVIADKTNADKIDAAEKLLNRTVKVKISVDEKRPGWHQIDCISTEKTVAKTARTASDDHLFYFFTSGTTGLPKVVAHTQFTYPVGHLTTSAWIGLRSGDVHYNISAPGWAKFAYSSFFAPWNMGATIFANQVEKFEAKEQLQAIEKYGITTFCAPPTVLRMFILEDFSPYKFQLRQCVAAGEPLNPEIIEKWKKGTGILIRDGFGQTETTLLAANLPNAHVKFGSMGKATFLYEIVIADENGLEMPPLEEGNICVKMAKNQPTGVFLEYFGDRERMKNVFKNGLYYTGDKAYKDDDGFIWFVGRDDDVIKASDYRIGPFEVESVLIEHESVIEAAVIASPHELRGFSVKAVVVLANGFQPGGDLAEKLFAFCEQNLARYKIPRIIEFAETLPKTISGKIRRVELRAAEAVKKQTSELEFFYSKY